MYVGNNLLQLCLFISTMALTNIEYGYLPEILKDSIKYNLKLFDCTNMVVANVIVLLVYLYSEKLKYVFAILLRVFEQLSITLIVVEDSAGVCLWWHSRWYSIMT